MIRFFRKSISIPANRSRRAFSLLELAITTLIVGIAVVITIPVILKSQVQARQSGCASRMANLAQSVLAFEQSNGRLPVAGLVAPNPFTDTWGGTFDQLSGPQLSWITLTLPFMGQQDIYDSFDLNALLEEQPGNTGKSIPSLICPEDTAGAKGLLVRQLDNRIFGLGNYAGFTSPYHGETVENFPGALGGFEPGTSVGQRLARISDGASSTYLLSEVRRRPPEDLATSPLSTTRSDNLTLDPRGAWAICLVGSSTLSPDAHHMGFAEDPFNPGWPSQIVTPNTISGGSTSPDQVWVCPQPASSFIDEMPCARYARFGGGFAIAAARSLHDGGVNSAFVDGRVEFVSNDIDPAIYAHLVSINNGQPSMNQRRASKFGRASKSTNRD